MMKPEHSFALFTNDSAFSLRVSECLLKNQFLPKLVVLPQYPPAQFEQHRSFPVRPTPRQPAIVKLFADIPLVYAPSASPAVLIDKLHQFSIDFILVACWPYLLDQSILCCASQAALNIHPSLLPEYRGADPLNQQIAARDLNGGVTLHLLDDQFDHGDIVDQASFHLSESELRLDYLEARCAALAVALFISAIKMDMAGWKLTPQD